ncbi:MAG: SRPBCC domain-containing protein [Myxococcota bacterium]|nr:SRPBCC domain-containing protein [Myxococcota bacterium]
MVHGSFAVEREFDVSPSRLFAAWCDVSMKARWFIGPPGAWTLIERALDVRVGGHETLRGRRASGVETLFSARYHAVIPNQRLVFAYDMHLDGKHSSTSLVTVELTARGATRTLLTFTEQAAFHGGDDGTESRRHVIDADLARLTDELVDPRDIVSSRLFRAPREDLFEAFRDGGRLAAWWGPKGFSCAFDVFEPRAGGRWRFTMQGPDGVTYPMVKDFTEVTAPERVAYRHSQEGHAFTMHMTFVDAGDATLLIWRMRFDSVEEAKRVRSFIESANEENFDRLEAHLGRS